MILNEMTGWVVFDPARLFWYILSYLGFKLTETYKFSI